MTTTTPAVVGAGPGAGAVSPPGAHAPSKRATSEARRVPVRMLVGRLLAIPVSIFAVATSAFWLMRLTGGNAASTLAGEYATSEQIAQVEEDLGINKPALAQYGDFLTGLLRGDLGTSFFTRQPVTEELFGRLPLDLTVGVLALVVAMVVGVGLGALGAYYRDRAPDQATRVVVSILQSLPEYVFALLLIFVFFYKLDLMPAPVGQLPMREKAPDGPTDVALIDSLLAGNMDTFLSAAHQLVLPVLSFGLVLSAIFARVSRTAFAKVLSSGQIQYARACGLTPVRVFWSAFTVVRTTILTTVAVVIGAIIGGGAIMQKIFNLDGAAAFGVDSIFKFDMPVIQGIVIVFGSLTVVAFLVIDIVILLLDPRVRQKS